ncbi:MAG: DUF2283 domain-containing protein [Gemmatimonadota bacterium]
MRFDYYSETDTLYIELREGSGADAREVARDIILDLNAAGEVVGIEIDHASERTDLTQLQLSSLPARAPRTATPA